MTAAPRRADVARPVLAKQQPAADRPVARVAVDIPLAHLDRPFDYLIAEADSAAAQPGTRVRVRFAGRLVDGFILERADHSGHDGALAFIARLISPEVVLTASVARLCRAVADRYAGTLADVLRLAVPPRHGRTETALRDVAIAAGSAGRPTGQGGVIPAAPLTEQWRRYDAAAAFFDAALAGRPARAVWSAIPGEDWAARFAEAAAAAHSVGRGALLLVPDARDLARLAEALAATLPKSEFMTLSAGLGPSARYRRFLALSRGQVRVAAGTRAAAFAPVADLGLIAVFDDGDDSHDEPRAPYPHVRDIAMLRSTQESAALLLGGFARTAEAQLLVESGWARPIAAPRAVVRAALPRFEAAGDDYATGADSGAARARLSPAAFAAARAALAAGAPVLIQVPRRGYAPSLACADCRRPARCRRCSGPLALPRGGGSPRCRWCGITTPRWACPACGGARLKVSVIGALRTAEEIGRAFPGAQLITSGGDVVVDAIGADPAIIVATPGAEPVAADGYGAALLLDGGLLLSRPDLRAAEETLRRWMAAATLVRPAARGGRVIVGADLALPTVQALLRWDAAGHAEAELAARRELGFPPAAAMAAISGEEGAVAAALDALGGGELPADAQILGPVPVVARGAGRDAADYARALLRVPVAERKDLAAALKVFQSARSLHKEQGSLRIEMDPAALG